MKNRLNILIVITTALFVVACIGQAMLQWADTLLILGWSCLAIAIISIGVLSDPALSQRGKRFFAQMLGVAIPLSIAIGIVIHPELTTLVAGVPLDLSYTGAALALFLALFASLELLMRAVEKGRV